MDEIRQTLYMARSRFDEPVMLTGAISKDPEKDVEHPGGVCAETAAARARRATVYFMLTVGCEGGGWEMRR